MKPKFKLSTILSKLCVAVLALLGYSCGDNNNEEEPDIPCMYGSPTGHWEIKGAVTNEADAPVSEATILVTLPELDSSEYYMGKWKPDEAGMYVAEWGGIYKSLKVVCVPADASLKSDSTVVEMKYPGGAGWDHGTATATVDFKLKPKEGGSEK